MRVYAGFDGGGTRTTCVLCDSEGKVLGVGSGGRSNYHNVGLPHAVSSLRTAFEEALDASGLPTKVGVDACFGLAGLDSREDMAAMKGGIASMKLKSGPRKDLVVNDWRTALAGAFVEGPGVTLIAGTGCVAAAQNQGRTKVARVGGWGHVVDDRGSAYDIGKDALYAAMRSYDGRGPKTKILDLIMERLRVDEAQGIIAKVYVEHMPVSTIASLSTLVAKAAADGDKVAKQILNEKGRILGELVVSAASQLGMLGKQFGVSLNGGVFKAGPPVMGPLEETILAAAPGAKLVEARLPPALGAVVIMMKEVGDARVARMRSSFDKLA